MRSVIDVSGEERDAICALMERGVQDFELAYDSDDAYERARALWRKHCDPKAIDCEPCFGEGWLFGCEEEDYEHHTIECPYCYGTGKVDAPPPPPPPPAPEPKYTIQNAGMLNGRYRVWAWKTEPADSKLFTADTQGGAYAMAASWIATQPSEA